MRVGRHLGIHFLYGEWGIIWQSLSFLFAIKKYNSVNKITIIDSTGVIFSSRRFLSYQVYRQFASKDEQDFILKTIVTVRL